MAPNMFVLLTEELSGSGFSDLGAWLAGTRAGSMLKRSRSGAPRAGQLRANAQAAYTYVPSEEEKRMACVINSFDCALFQELIESRHGDSSASTQQPSNKG